MAVSHHKARDLMTKTEFKLFREASPTKSSNFTEKQLLQKIKLSRKYRDKYRTLSKKQRTAGKLKTDPKRTGQKLELFERALTHFEAAYQKAKEKRKLEEQKALKKVKSQTKKSSATRKKARPKSSKKPRSKTIAGLKKKARFNKASQQRIFGHIRAAGQRKQGKRDSR